MQNIFHRLLKILILFLTKVQRQIFGVHAHVYGLHHNGCIYLLLDVWYKQPLCSSIKYQFLHHRTFGFFYNNPSPLWKFQLINSTHFFNIFSLWESSFPQHYFPIPSVGEYPWIFSGTTHYDKSSRNWNSLFANRTKDLLLNGKQHFSLSNLIFVVQS